MVVEDDARTRTVDDALQRTEHDTLFVAKGSLTHVERPERTCWWREEWKQTILGPAKLVSFQNARIGFVYIENRISKCNLFNLVHISTNNSTIGEFRYHCCRLLCHELYRNHNDDGQQEYLFHFKGSLDVD